MEKPMLIQWDRKKLSEFKKVYEANKDAEQFLFEGYIFLPSYAKYLIEFLELQLKK